MTLAATETGEEERLRALDRLAIMDTGPEEAFDRLAQLAAHRFNVPIALVSFIDRDRQWFKSRVGIQGTAFSRRGSFCHHTIVGDGVMIAADPINDARFAQIDAVRTHGIRFYAGAPLVTEDGHRVGTICVMDRVARPDIGAAESADLARLAATAMDAVELHALRRRLNNAPLLQSLSLRQAEILDALPGHTAILDRDGRILAVNRSWRDFAASSGIAGPTPIGASYLDLCAAASWGDQARAIADGLAAVLAGRQAQLNIVHPCDHGAFRRWYRLMAAPISGDAGGAVAVHFDITSSRLAEDALRQSQKMEAVGQLTGGIAHDFNNMLTVIVGNLELLESKLSDRPRLLRLVNAATTAASRAEKLTQQLLTFSRRQQLQPQAIDLNQIVIGMGDLLHRTVGGGIDIRTQLAPDLWPALADPDQIETVLLNLVLNARDALPNGGRITIETGNVEATAARTDLAPGAYATLAVIDTGHGMPEAVAARAFEPFFTTKEMGRGSGLGLAQVYGFAKQSAGHVRIDSREGHGTTVRLYLPRAQDAGEALDHAAPATQSR